MKENNLAISKTERNNSKIRNLVLGVIFDFIGIISYALPILGDFSDLAWAPIAGFLMQWMYKGNLGKTAAIFAFLEEILPFSDFVPSFTITWFYVYMIKKDS